MNTVAKGDQFEARIFELFEAEIAADRFIFKRENCKIYSKKGYYSRDRDADIIFDVAIELFLPDQERPFQLVLIECKDRSY